MNPTFICESHRFYFHAITDWPTGWGRDLRQCLKLTTVTGHKKLVLKGVTETLEYESAYLFFSLPLVFALRYSYRHLPAVALASSAHHFLGLSNTSIGLSRSPFCFFLFKGLMSCNNVRSALLYLRHILYNMWPSFFFGSPYFWC